MNENEVLAVRCEGPVTVAELNRPGKANSINQPLIDALDCLAEQLENTADHTRVLVLTGAGQRAFSAGADVSELAGISRENARRQMQRGQEVFRRLESLPQPVIVAVNGVALGGGLELAMAGDIRIGAPHVRVGQPEMTLENLPGWGGTQRLPRLIGRGIALEMILTGDTIGAQRAHELGLLNQIVEDPLDRSIALANRIAKRSPVAVYAAKRVIDIGIRKGIEAGMMAEADAVSECCQTPEQRNAVAQFLTKSARR